MRQGWQIARWRGIPILITPMWLAVTALFSVASSTVIRDRFPALGGFAVVAGFLFICAIYLTILIHEFSHAVMARRFGLGVHSITLNFLGGATRIEGRTANPRQEFWLAAVGPLTSLGVAGVLWSVSQLAPTGIVGGSALVLAWINAFLGVLNLIPGIPFDGGHMLQAGLWAWTKDRERATFYAARAGQVLGLGLVGIGLSPIGTGTGFGLIIVGVFVIMTATATTRISRARQGLTGLRVRELLVPALALPSTTPISVAMSHVHQAEQASVGIVTTDTAGAVAGLVSQAALHAVPVARQPFMTLAEVSQELQADRCVDLDLDGEALVRHLQQHPAHEYAVVGQGRIVGVLLMTRVNAAFQEIRKRR